MHQCTHGCGPEYLKHLLTKKPTVRSLQNSAEHKTFGDRSFSYSGPHLWNSLPTDMCKSTLISNKNAKLSFPGNTLRTCYSALIY